ncbi:hypothetical protein P7C65_11s1g17920 [Encephalitozoon intestinalis]|nr:hypothetical protein GPK93_11g19570 [Encephalitozoon intestinalis]
MLSSISYLDHNFLMDIEKKYGSEVTPKLVKERFLEYKSDYKNEVDRIVLDVKERRKEKKDSPRKK